MSLRMNYPSNDPRLDPAFGAMIPHDAIVQRDYSPVHISLAGEIFYGDETIKSKGNRPIVHQHLVQILYNDELHFTDKKLLKEVPDDKTKA